ncbi:MAG TPA: NAD(P)H-dependent glycerol-3-phosphate dehydrogenase [Candidatus Megaira endosymbiont of Nemacystus decipiens]|nr:NAD(P)H-dependent glycerol-3-phosphate dehydrogenase [Candidatus Megaera endosymbiont of Nemacystus decipiens]
MSSDKNFAIIGGGSWGTALACTFARVANHSLLYTKNQGIASEINKNHTNKKYLQDTLLCKKVRATSNFLDILDYDFIVIATPSSAFDSVIDDLNTYQLKNKSTLLIASKGMCSNPLQLFSEKIKSSLNNRFAFIHGPNFAKEMAEGKQASITVASENKKTREDILNAISSKQLIVESTNDIWTVQIASMAKNIFAIKSGIMQAQGAGENIKASLISQALTEISILSVHLGGSYKSLSLASVIGDLVLTCYSQTSRNTRFGYEFYNHNYSKEFLKNYPILVEGIQSARLLDSFSASFGIELPIIREIANLVKI